ncbi:MAG: YuzD family protein [Anaerobacillus sp.]|uniref:YuzD family protein n=1 Tax=Anaerobacillus sp. TaxID=1872506 RepID=UPI00391B046A
MSNPVKIYVYGAEVKCASCVNLPSALETFEWIEAAVNRKYPNNHFQFIYVDLNAPTNEEEKKMATHIVEEDLFYPVVVVNEEIVAEGNPRLADIYKVLDEM